MSDQEMVQCPFNAAHVILKARLAAHLVKCSQQHASEKFSVCPFNATHRVPTPDLEYHCKTCEDRKTLESHLYVVSDEPKPDDDNFYAVELPASNENWDEETTHVGSYLNVKNEVLENNQIFRVPIGLSKAERKLFFRGEVDRFGNMPSQNMQSSTFTSASQHAGQMSAKSKSNGSQNITRGLNQDTKEAKDSLIVMRSKGRGQGSLLK